jgi:hypothetical protein
MHTDEVAWAAGFFDAEGTASSSQRLDRPSRERQMAVYQGGRDEIPEALLRFQRAVGGRGNITGPYRERLFHWTTKKHTAFDEVMTMLWPVPASQPSRTTELAWVAGFFDGEGYIGARGVPGRRTIEISIAQASSGELPTTLSRVALVIGVGSLRGPRMLPNPWSKLPQYVGAPMLSKMCSSRLRCFGDGLAP